MVVTLPLLSFSDLFFDTFRSFTYDDDINGIP